MDTASGADFDVLRARLETEPSVTAVLDDWCARHGIGEGPLRSVRLDVVDALPSDPILARALGATPGERVVHRRIRLMRGAVPLLVADNWYRPALLPAAMRAAFEEGDTPFGPAIATLDPRRRLIGSTAGGVSAAEGTVILTLEAALVLPDGRPVSVVRERLLSTLVTSPGAGVPAARIL